MSKKLVDSNGLEKLSQGLHRLNKEMIEAEQSRAVEEEQALKSEIELTKNMFDGRAIKYITQADYDQLPEAERNSTTVTYFITDAEDLSHDHNNKDFLDNLDARNITIGNKSQLFDGVNDLVYSIKDIGAAPASHNHDEYYTKSEIDTEIGKIEDSLLEKADKIHNHDDKYYTEGEIDDKLNNKADKVHSHDDKYYTEDEIDDIVDTINTNIANKAPLTHEHTEYALKSKVEEDLKTIGNSIDDIETDLSEVQTQLSNKSDSTHKHSDLYLTEEEIDAKLDNKSDTSHDHDDDYYLKTEIDTTVESLQTAINGKSDSGHHHDDDYYTEGEIDKKLSDIDSTITEKVSDLNTAIVTAKTGAISESKSYTDEAITKLVDSAPDAMNTLNELAKSINDHQSEYEAYVETVTNAIATAKADAISDADSKDEALHAIISKEIDDDVAVEKERATKAESALGDQIAEKSPIGHIHDDIYYTEDEIDDIVSALQKEIDNDVLTEKERAMEAESVLQANIDKKANESHGNHIPDPQTADNAIFLRNDNTWAKVTPSNIGAAAEEHGDHIPAPQTTDNTMFLRNDNVWAAVTPTNIGAALAVHEHDDKYFTEDEINNKIEDVNITIETKESILQGSIEDTIDMFGGKSIRYITQAEYEQLSEGERNSDSVTYFILDANDLSHEHENKDFLDNLNAINLTVGNKTQMYDGTKDLAFSLTDIGAALSEHNHNEAYFTKTEIETKIENINDVITANSSTLQTNMNAKADKDHNHDDRYITNEIITTQVENIYMVIDNNHAAVMAATNNKADKIHVHSSADIQDRIKNIGPTGNKLILTTDKVQVVHGMTSDLEIEFPVVSTYTQIHVYFDAEEDMNLILPEGCRWRLDANIETGKSYELIATYTTRWLVNILIYSE